MMSSIVYSVNYLLITYVVYSENYHVCLLITTRTFQSGGYNHSRQGFMAINNPSSLDHGLSTPLCTNCTITVYITFMIYQNSLHKVEL